MSCNTTKHIRNQLTQEKHALKIHGLPAPPSTGCHRHSSKPILEAEKYAQRILKYETIFTSALKHYGKRKGRKQVGGSRSRGRGGKTGQEETANWLEGITPSERDRQR
jgi:hypothetical protein